MSKTKALSFEVVPSNFVGDGDHDHLIQWGMAHSIDDVRAAFPNAKVYPLPYGFEDRCCNDFDLTADEYLIFAPGNDAHCGQYWSDEDGWTDRGCASVYTLAERLELQLPMSEKMDAQWVPYVAEPVNAE